MLLFLTVSSYLKSFAQIKIYGLHKTFSDTTQGTYTVNHQYKQILPTHRKNQTTFRLKMVSFLALSSMERFQIAKSDRQNCWHSSFNIQKYYVGCHYLIVESLNNYHTSIIISAKILLKNRKACVLSKTW